MNLRQSLVRLAHANPDLRPQLLPLIREAGGADALFQSHVKDVRKLLSGIGHAVQTMAIDQKKDPLDYSYSGSMGHVAMELQEILRFLQG